MTPDTPVRRQADSPPSHLRAMILTLAAVAVGLTLPLISQTLEVSLIGVGLLLTALVVVLPRWPRGDIGHRLLIWVMRIATAAELAVLTFSPQVRHMSIGHGPSTYVFWVGIVVIAMLALLLIDVPGPIGRAAFLALVASYTVLGAWMISQNPHPMIDVFDFQQKGAAALLHGVDPFSLHYKSLYPPGSPLYSPEVQANGFLKFGFPYPPLSLLGILPSYVLFGDHRYAQLAAVALSALLIGHLTPRLISRRAAALLLLTPASFYVLISAWTEPLVALALSAMLFCAVRAPRFLPVALGLVLGMKQYLAPLALLAIPLLRRQRPHGWVRALVVSLAVAALVAVPFVLWDPGGFWQSVVRLQFLQPYRVDSRSFLALLVGKHQPGALQWVAFGLAGSAMLLVLIRGVATPARLAVGVAFIYLAFFAFSKQSFMNYYYFCIAALCAAVAIDDASEPPDAEQLSRPVSRRPGARHPAAAPPRR
ncbi:MAG: hypothetical protein ACR2KI_01225 [Candidatus Limnocylindria bacterium]